MVENYGLCVVIGLGGVLDVVPSNRPGKGPWAAAACVNTRQHF